MNNYYRPLSGEEVKSKKSEVLNKLNIFLKKHKPGALKDISERKKQLREKAVKVFGDIQLKNLTYTQSSEKLFSDQNLLLHNKQKEFLMENKSEILNLLEFIENVNGKNLSSSDIEKHMFDMTNVNTFSEKVWYNTTKALRLAFFPIGYIHGFCGTIALSISTEGLINSLEFRSFLSLTWGILLTGGTWALGDYVHKSSSVTKRAEEIKSHNNLFVKAYIYKDNSCKNILENKI